MKASCLVIGSGWMAQEYLKAAKFISDLSICFYAPSGKNKDAIQNLGGKFYTDLEKAFSEAKPTHVIVASSIDTLAAVTGHMVEKGIRNILVEKPAFLYEKDGEQLIKKTEGAKVYVGYNRRFYASAAKALEMIKKNDEKFKGVQFEFTELASDFAASPKFPTEVKSHWAHSNSSHVIDFAFFPIGLPRTSEFNTLRVGELSWHPTASEMVGCGISEKGIPFSYSAYWGGVGRWSVEWITDKTRYIFRPMEKLSIQKLGSFSYEEIALDWKFEGAKHGLVEQLQGFLQGDDSRLLSLKDSMALHKTVSKMAGYKQ